ncbi:hypothetical protein M758_UG014400 [Ceratodon purpureus]|nr:hypothetical protein M758_UG014400 [Ceratodon purpureus]
MKVSILFLIGVHMNRVIISAQRTLHSNGSKSTELSSTLNFSFIHGFRCIPGQASSSLTRFGFLDYFRNLLFLRNNTLTVCNISVFILHAAFSYRTEHYSRGDVILLTVIM